VISEDAVGFNAKHDDLEILNQWTYHSRLFDAAKYVAEKDNIQFVQLVNFGCGCDAITTDECRRILESRGKLYTQIKIDEIENLGAVKIRLRSLFAAAGIGE
jgi:predicted nucleotide-binding protein (sugar kinase/HSP70/actin superfamily)